MVVYVSSIGGNKQLACGRIFHNYGAEVGPCVKTVTEVSTYA